MTPAEATKPSNAVEATTNLEVQAIFTRKYPELEIGTGVKIYNKKTLGQKYRVSRFSPTVFTVTNIAGNTVRTIIICKVSSGHI